MSKISLVVVVDENNGLGYQNRLLCHLPADLKHFKEITWGKPIVMGYKTYQSIGRVLPGRQNIILSRQTRDIPGAHIAHSVHEVLDLSADAPEVMIIGGAEIFKQFLKYTRQIYLTRIHHLFTADTYFPDILDASWQCQSKKFQTHDEKNLYNVTFFRYARVFVQDSDGI